MNSERSVILRQAGQRLIMVAVMIDISGTRVDLGVDLKIAGAVARAAGRLDVVAAVAALGGTVDLDPLEPGDLAVRLHGGESQDLRAVRALDGVPVSAETGLGGQEPVFPVTAVARRSTRVVRGFVVHLVRAPGDAADLVTGADGGRVRGGREGRGAGLRHANTVARGGTPDTVPTGRHSRCGYTHLRVMHTH